MTTAICEASYPYRQKLRGFWREVQDRGRVFCLTEDINFFILDIAPVNKGKHASKRIVLPLACCPLSIEGKYSKGHVCSRWENKDG